MQRSSFRVDYSGCSDGPGYDAWREGVVQEIQRLDVEPLREGPLEVTSEVVLFPGVLTMRGSLEAPVAFRRTEPLLRDGNGDVAVLMPRGGNFGLEAARQPMNVLTSGEVGVWDLSRAGALQNLLPSTMTLLKIERERLDHACANWEDSLHARCRRRDGLGVLLRDYVALVAPQREEFDAAGAALVGQHIIDLAVLALGARGDERHIASRRGLRAARLERVKSVILAELSDTALSVEEVARRFQLSDRSIQLMFEESGTTFTDFVLEHRLQAALRMLTNPSLSGSKISAIALNVGFGDLSYFHRVFRRRFGDTPGAFRSRAAGTDES